MLNLLLKPLALEDLENIFSYTFDTWGLRQAEKYQNELHQGMLSILENPEIGMPYNYTIVKYRKIHVNRHLIFYRIEDKSCIIIRILHDRVNIRSHIK